MDGDASAGDWGSCNLMSKIHREHAELRSGWSTDQFVDPQSDPYRPRHLRRLRSPPRQEEIFIEGELDLMTSTKNTKKPHPHRLPFPLD